MELQEAHTEQIQYTHFGAVRGLNAWGDCRSAVIVGRESVSIEAVEDLARAYMANDPMAFVSTAGAPPRNWAWPFWPYRATRGRRMANGSVAAVEVEVHPDPRVQAVLEQLREGRGYPGGGSSAPYF
jgi:hypothetical protein